MLEETKSKQIPANISKVALFMENEDGIGYFAEITEPNLASMIAGMATKISPAREIEPLQIKIKFKK